MAVKCCIREMAVVLFWAFMLSGCSEQNDNVTMLSSVEIGETDFKKRDCRVFVEADGIMDAAFPEIKQEIPEEENSVVEIYNGGEDISVSEDIMSAQVSPQEILAGRPVLYNCFRTDGWVFEWLISDYRYENNMSMEEGVLVVSREGNGEEVQILHVEAEGRDGTWVSAERKFEYGDVNFDGLPDLLICGGRYGVQGVLKYYCFLRTENGFAEAPSFTDISNPKADAESELVLGQWRNSADSHSWAEYKYQNGTYVLIRELREDTCYQSDQAVRVWTINGIEVGRSDLLSEEGIEDLLYNENSEWKLDGDRWRMKYH